MALILNKTKGVSVPCRSVFRNYDGPTHLFLAIIQRTSDIRIVPQ